MPPRRAEKHELSHLWQAGEEEAVSTEMGKNKPASIFTNF